MRGLRGVNLGGWLVLERWMTPSVFSDTEAVDEITLSKEHRARIKKHHQTFITEEDFAWIAKQGIDATRIPIGYWIFGDAPPFVGSIDRLDFAFAMAKKYHLQVIISLHGAPESQNGKRHSGQGGKPGWHWNKPAKAKTLETVERLAQRYGGHSQLWGIEVLNEPTGGLFKNFVLRKYYRATYKIIRELCGERVKVIISDGYHPNTWIHFMNQSRYKNVVMDTHLYQCYSPADQRASITEQLDKAANRRSQILDWQKHQPVMVGEWGMGMGPHTLDNLDEAKVRILRQAYARAQIKSYDQAAAWFFWSYKTEHTNNWNFRYLKQTGIIEL